MAAHPNILVCLDSDPQPSVFDSVVAADCGVDHLLRHGNVRPGDVRDLVHGAMFTRGPADLHHTAVFIGGSDVAVGESLLAATRDAFFGPIRVSAMLDSGGANTTAAAAVLVAGRELALQESLALVMGATGPVGQRVVRLLAREGTRVRVGSRRQDRAEQVCQAVRESVPPAQLTASEITDDSSLEAALADCGLVIAAGAAGVELIGAPLVAGCQSLRVAIDLNAVPPPGIGGIGTQDCGREENGVRCFGAIGVGGIKMKIHKAAVRQLFESNDQLLDAEEIFELGKEFVGDA